jgi:hypothetical protein
MAAVDQVPSLRRRGELVDVLRRDVLEQHGQVHLLLVVGTERRQLLLSDDGEHGRHVELRVVEAVEEVDRPGAGGGEAHADLAGELRVRAGHERRELLVADLDELDLVPELVEGAEDAVDPVARIAVDAPHAPLAGQAAEEEGADVLGHRRAPESQGSSSGTRLPRPHPPMGPRVTRVTS